MSTAIGYAPAQAENEEIIRQIWEKTRGRKDKSPPPSKNYQLLDIRYTDPPSIREQKASLQRSLDVNPQLGITVDQLSTAKQLKTPESRLPNFFRVGIQFDGGPIKQVTLYYGCVDDGTKPNSQPWHWPQAKDIWLTTCTRATDQLGIMFMDIHPQNRSSPFHWEPSRLKAAGINMLIDTGGMGSNVLYDDMQVAETETLRTSFEDKYDTQMVLNAINNLKPDDLEALYKRLFGLSGISSIPGPERPRERRVAMYVGIQNVMEADPAKVKRAMIGDFPTLSSAIAFGVRLGVLELRGNTWFLKGSDGVDMEIEDLHVDKGADPELELANFLYGLRGDGKPRWEYYSTIQSILGEVNKVAKEIPALGASEDDQEAGSAAKEGFRTIILQAVAEGRIVPDNTASRWLFNPAKEGDPTLPGFKRLSKSAPDSEVKEWEESRLSKLVDTAWTKNTQVLERLGN